MRVRPATREDLPDVSKLAAELVRLHHRLDPLRFFSLDSIEEGYRRFFGGELRRKGAVILVAEREGEEPAGEGEILGYAYATLEPRNWNDLLDACGKLNDIYVHPSGRRLGTGRALLSAAVAAMKELGAPRVVLMTAWQNPEAHAFFEALGFRRTMLEMTKEVT